MSSGGECTFGGQADKQSGDRLGSSGQREDATVWESIIYQSLSGKCASAEHQYLVPSRCTT
jgi:hypothetical protein